MAARQRLTFAAVAVAVAVAAAILLGGARGAREGAERPASAGEPGGATTPGRDAASGSHAEPEEAEPRPRAPRVARIRVRGGEPVGGVRELAVLEGDRIRFNVTSDVADHVHLHGYDVFEDVGPGRTATFDVPATITGVFEAELEDRGVPVVRLRVAP